MPNATSRRVIVCEKNPSQDPVWAELTRTSRGKQMLPVEVVFSSFRGTHLYLRKDRGGVPVGMANHLPEKVKLENGFTYNAYVLCVKGNKAYITM